MSDCIFCKIINKEINSNTLYEDNDFIAILDVFPSTLGHTLIIPKTHSSTIFELDDKSAENLGVVIKKVSCSLKMLLNFDGMNILQNNGESAGQSVHHVHFHLIPRYENDDIRISWNINKPSNEEITKLVEEVKRNVK